jgi:hypothetical protein
MMMSTIAANENELNREEIDGRVHVGVTTTTPVMASKFVASLRQTQRPAKARTNHHPSSRRQECAAVVNFGVTAQQSIARSVKVGLASSDITRGEPPSAQRSAPTGSTPDERTTADSYLAFGPPSGKPRRERRNNFRAEQRLSDTVFGFASGGAI